MDIAPPQILHRIEQMQRPVNLTSSPVLPLPLTTSQTHLVFEAPERVQMLLRGVKRPAARRHREVGCADCFPALHGLYPVRRSRARQVHTAFQPKGPGVATGFFGVLPYAGND